MEENYSNIQHIRKFKRESNDFRSDLYIQKQKLSVVLPSVRVPEWMAMGLKENFSGSLSRMTRDFYKQQLNKIGVHEPQDDKFLTDEDLK